MLGFSSDEADATTESRFGLVSGDFIMDDVQCEGVETDINDCFHHDHHNCGAGEGAGVRCRVSPFDDNLKEELEEIKDENEKLQDTVNFQQSELRALKTQLEDLSSYLMDLEGTVGFDDTVLTDLIISSDEFSGHLSSFNDSLTSLASSVNEHETKLSSHHDQIHSVIVKAASNSQNIEDISTAVDGLSSNLTELEGKVGSDDTVLTTTKQQGKLLWKKRHISQSIYKILKLQCVSLHRAPGTGLL